MNGEKTPVKNEHRIPSYVNGTGNMVLVGLSYNAHSADDKLKVGQFGTSKGSLFSGPVIYTTG
jgi:hypothetical protein